MTDFRETASELGRSARLLYYQVAADAEQRFNGCTVVRFKPDELNALALAAFALSAFGAADQNRAEAPALSDAADRAAVAFFPYIAQIMFGGCTLSTLGGGRGVVLSSENPAQ